MDEDECENCHFKYPSMQLKECVECKWDTCNGCLIDGVCKSCIRNKEYKIKQTIVDEFNMKLMKACLENGLEKSRLFWVGIIKNHIGQISDLTFGSFSYLRLNDIISIELTNKQITTESLAQLIQKTIDDFESSKPFMQREYLEKYLDKLQRNKTYDEARINDLIKEIKEIDKYINNIELKLK